MAHAPGQLGCGLRVDGRDIGINFSRIPDAESAASRLFADGFKQVEIFDRASGLSIGEKSFGLQQRMETSESRLRSALQPAGSTLLRR